MRQFVLSFCGHEVFLSYTYDYEFKTHFFVVCLLYYMHYIVVTRVPRISIQLVVSFTSIWTELLINCVLTCIIFVGIGVDDSFVLTAAWRRTSTADSVPKRMADTYSEASVSITITSLTDACSFFVGVITPLPALQIFSTYAGVSVVFVYLWQLIFFGGCMALSGIHEEKKRHGFFFWKQAIFPSQAGKTSYKRKNSAVSLY